MTLTHNSEEFLSGCDVLLVRAPRERDVLVDLLEQQKAVVTQLPVMQIRLLNSEAHLDDCVQAISRLPQIHKAVFVSKNAVRVFPRIMERMAERLRDTEYLAVGASTASALSNLGIPVIFPQQEFTSEALLALPNLRHVVEKNIVIFSGEGGRQLLSQVLAQRGAKVIRCELYRREPDISGKAAIQNFLDTRLDPAIMVHSVELLRCLQNIVDPEYQQKLKDSLIVVPGKRVAEAASKAGFLKACQADSAVPQDMVSALQECYSKQQKMDQPG